MDPREELQALRRMAELEAKASGAAAVTPVDTTPQWGRENPNLFKAAQATRQYLGPTLEAGGAIGGAALGTMLAPGPGTVGGAGLGYGIASGINKVADVVLGNVPPETAPQALTRGAKDVLTGATLEAGGAVAGKVLSKAEKAAGWVWDAFSGKLVNVRAGKIAREIAGADLGTIKDLAKSAGPNLTAAQATQASGNNVLAALGEKAAKNDVTNFFSRTAAEQEAARKATLQGVTPDLAATTAARDAAAKVNYDRAFAADLQRQRITAEAAAAQKSLAQTTGAAPVPTNVTPALEALKTNPVIQAAAKEASVLARTEGASIGDPMASLQGLHYMKLAIDNQFKNRAAATALQNYSAAALQNTKTRLLGAMEDTSISPLYGVARQTYAAQSAPVDQSRVLGAMQDVLAKPGGGERVVPFLNVLGTGENALIKRAGGDPRFGGLEEVLTPKQMGAVNDIAGQFTRDLALAQSAAAGRGGLSRVLRETSSSAELPPSINLYTRSVNKVLSLVEGRVNVDTRNVLEKGMRSGKDLLTVLNTLPASERVAALQALGQTPGKQLGRAAVYGTNAFAPEILNQLGQ